MFSSRLYLKLFLSIMMVYLINSCTSEIINDSNLQPLEIDSFYIQYDNSGLLISRLDFVDGSPLDEVLRVEIQFQIPEDNTIIEALYDNGTNGDSEANNGSYNLTKEITLNSLVYNVSFFVYAENDTLVESAQLAVGNYPPSIKDVCMPESIEIVENNFQWTLVSLPISDSNGLNDINSVKFKIRYYDGYCRDNDCDCNSQNSCSHYISNDELDEYQEDDTYILELTPNLEDMETKVAEIDGSFGNGSVQFGNQNECSHLFQNNNEYIYMTMLPFKPYSCGGWGEIGFIFEVIDNSGLEFETEEYKLELFYEPGECE